MTKSLEESRESLKRSKEYLFKLYAARELLRLRLTSYFQHNRCADDLDRFNRENVCIIGNLLFKEDKDNNTMEFSFFIAKETQFKLTTALMLGESRESWKVILAENEINLLCEKNKHEFARNPGVSFINTRNRSLKMTQDGEIITKPDLGIQKQAEMLEKVVKLIQESPRTLRMCVPRYEEAQGTASKDYPLSNYHCMQFAQNEGPKQIYKDDNCSKQADTVRKRSITL